MKELKINSLTCELASNITVVDISLFEVTGTLKRLSDNLVLTLEGRFTNIDDVLIEAVTEELDNNGITL